jgi:sugar lactone lactonase YvrE
VSSIGIEVDEPRGRLLVANSDASVFQGDGAGQAKLGVYDLDSGERIAMVDLAATLTDAFADAVYFANDVAVGDDGTAYVTDTRMNVIYQVDADYNASVLYRFAPTEDLGLNGIVFHESGYLLVAGGTTLWKVPVADPTETTQVTLSEATAGHDGMLWTADGLLAIVSNSENRVIALTSADEWATAELAGVGTFEGQATTGADVNGEIYVVHPHFADADAPSIERVTLQ